MDTEIWVIPRYRKEKHQTFTFWCEVCKLNETVDELLYTTKEYNNEEDANKDAQDWMEENGLQ